MRRHRRRRMDDRWRVGPVKPIREKRFVGRLALDMLPLPRQGCIRDKRKSDQGGRRAEGGGLRAETWQENPRYQEEGWQVGKGWG